MSCNDAFRTYIKNQIILISIHSFNERPELWTDLRTRVCLSKTPDSLKHEALSKIQNAINSLQNCGKNFPDCQFTAESLSSQLQLNQTHTNEPNI